MATFDHVIQSTAEQLLEDEQWRSNLEDRESKIVLDWALEWLGKQMRSAPDEARAHAIAERELARVRAIAKTINSLAKRRGKLKLAEVSRSLETALPPQRALARAETAALVAKFEALWKLRGDQ